MLTRPSPPVRLVATVRPSLRRTTRMTASNGRGWQPGSGGIRSTGHVGLDSTAAVTPVPDPSAGAAVSSRATDSGTITRMESETLTAQTGTGNGKVVESFSPLTGERIGSVPALSP